jgi:hypothetical protein
MCDELPHPALSPKGRGSSLLPMCHFKGAYLLRNTLYEDPRSSSILRAVLRAISTAKFVPRSHG